MIRYIYPGMLFIITIIVSCNNLPKTVAQESATNVTELSATEFAAKIKELPKAVVIDVRTPGEFAKGHLINAQNFDWNGTSFQEQIAAVDKAQPVFVYCLSGARSAAAADHMRKNGFQNVYELKGGIMQWRAENLPETTKSASAGMTHHQFEQLLKTDKLVLVDFYAEWCGPCKQMEPSLMDISNEMKDELILIRIDVDENEELSKILNVKSLPTLQLYKNKKLIWSERGLLTKEEIIDELK
jgi:thioredoxin 1